MQLELGQKIRELRHRDGRTQEMLADALGVTSQAISRWEALGGERRLSRYGDHPCNCQLFRRFD